MRERIDIMESKNESFLLSMGLTEKRIEELEVKMNKLVKKYKTLTQVVIGLWNDKTMTDIEVCAGIFVFAKKTGENRLIHKMTRDLTSEVLRQAGRN